MESGTRLIRAAYRRGRDLLQDIGPANRSSEGFLFKGSLHRFTTSSDEIGTTKTIKAIRSKVDRFVNIGANAGFYCLLAEKLGLKCIGFEPEAKMYRRLLRNTYLNTSKCIVLPVALSDKPGPSFLYGTGTAGSLIRGVSGNADWDRQIVQAETADNILPIATGQDLWLIDCEGAEPNIISGAKRHISNKPILILEYMASRNSENWKAALTMLEDNGYDCAFSMSDAARGLYLPKDLSRIDNMEGDNVLVMSRVYHKDTFETLTHSGSILDKDTYSAKSQ